MFCISKALTAWRRLTTVAVVVTTAAMAIVCLPGNAYAQQPDAADLQQPATTPDPEPPKSETPAPIVGRFATLSDFGSEDLAFMAVPRTPPIGAIIILHDRFGINKQMKAITTAFAEQGYIAIAPDLFNGQTANDPTSANSLSANLRTASALKTLNAAVKLITTSPKFKVERFAVLGWGMGGKFALESLADLKNPKGLRALCAYYPPVNTIPRKEIGRVRIPTLVFFGNGDARVPLTQIQEWEKRMKDEGARLSIQLVEAGTDFADPNSPGYNRNVYFQCWTSTVEFLRSELAKDKSNILDKLNKILD
ncbi:MAG: dienelactone hydrolase family protein [Candidatus Methylacidiphilales bacterium]|nr:dienelactone hydrolase family protein [Candidatus Methylacidiphilales bacterium]